MEEPKKPAVSMWLWITLIIVVLVAGGFFAWYYLISETSTKNSSSSTTQAPATTTSNSTCDLAKVTGLTPGTTWDILGGENFSTAVCGYLKTETIHNEMDNVTNDIASLVITSYKDAGFKTVIEKVANEGNSVNSCTKMLVACRVYLSLNPLDIFHFYVCPLFHIC